AIRGFYRPSFRGFSLLLELVFHCILTPAFRVLLFVAASMLRLTTWGISLPGGCWSLSARRPDKRHANPRLSSGADGRGIHAWLSSEPFFTPWRSTMRALSLSFLLPLSAICAVAQAA